MRGVPKLSGSAARRGLVRQAASLFSAISVTGLRFVRFIPLNMHEVPGKHEARFPGRPRLCIETIENGSTAFQCLSALTAAVSRVPRRTQRKANRARLQAHTSKLHRSTILPEIDDSSSCRVAPSRRVLTFALASEPSSRKARAPVCAASTDFARR